MKRLLKLAEDKRSPFLNTILGAVCAFVSGSINAGGFIVFGQYTSHVTGVIASAADAIVFPRSGIIFKSGMLVFCFFVGAILATLLIQYAQKLKLHSRFALAFLVGGLVLLILGGWIYFYHVTQHWALIMELGFSLSMGIQNATVTRLSGYEIRATHMTGIVTDLGIESGKWLFDRKSINLDKFKLLFLIVSSFFIGGICGFFTFSSSLGSSSLFLYGGILVGLSIFPVFKDFQIRRRYVKVMRKRRGRKLK